jgi:hypothetical protein
MMNILSANYCRLSIDKLGAVGFEPTYPEGEGVTVKCILLSTIINNS